VDYRRLFTNWEKNRNAPQIQYYPRIINFLGYLPFNIDLTTLPGKLKAHRYIKGLSQNQLGKILSVYGATVGSWELEENNPHEVILAKLDIML
jgi:DNA-binding XRE family transcriptional regulator